MARRETPEINAGSMADIAFLLLIFFLVTTTMDIDTGLTRQLPPYNPETPENDELTKERNVFVVLIKFIDQQPFLASLAKYELGTTNSFITVSPRLETFK